MKLANLQENTKADNLLKVDNQIKFHVDNAVNPGFRTSNTKSCCRINQCDPNKEKCDCNGKNIVRDLDRLNEDQLVDVYKRVINEFKSLFEALDNANPEEISSINKNIAKSNKALGELHNRAAQLGNSTVSRINSIY